jgi:hypothetical protein
MAASKEVVMSAVAFIAFARASPPAVANALFCATSAGTETYDETGVVERDAPNNGNVMRSEPGAALSSSASIAKLE